MAKNKEVKQQEVTKAEVVKGEEFKKLYFSFDALVDGVVVYEKGKEHLVPVAKGSADRWIKRGAKEV